MIPGGSDHGHLGRPQMTAGPASRRGGEVAYDYYIVALLAGLYMLSFMDRTLIGLLIRPIQHEFGLSNTQVGELLGFGFVLLYAVLGLVFGDLADRASRKWLIVAGLSAWSVATMAGGFAVAFLGLFAARACVGVGEASLSPCAYSTLADRFTPARLGGAVAIYASGVTVGSGLALVFGGVLVQWAAQTTLRLGPATLHGWRLTLVAVGALGLPFALLTALTFREAARVEAVRPARIGDILDHLRAPPIAVAAVLFAFALANIPNYALGLWTPTFLMQSQGLSAQMTGVTLGLVVGIAGTLGTVLGGVLSNHLVQRGVGGAPFRIILWAIVLELPFGLLAYTLHERWAVIASLTLLTFFATAASGLQGMAIQTLVAERLRGRLTSIYLLVVTLVAMGGGMFLIGWLSDQSFLGAMRLAKAITLASTTALLLSAGLLARRRSSSATV